MAPPAGALRVAVLGANGRMGRAVVRLAHEAGMQVVAAIGAGDAGKDAGELAGVGTLGVKLVHEVAVLGTSDAQVVVDFSAPDALAAALPHCAKAKLALVSGTTGLHEIARAALADAALLTPVLWEPNMSVGVHLLSALVKQAARALGESYDIEVVEAHHRAKVDAPSGTAVRLADAAREVRASSTYVHGREGRPGPRKATEIGMHAVRGGDVVGDHTVIFAALGERVELTHKASSRDIFARGAIRAAIWAHGKTAGLYDMRDVLGLK